MSVNIMSSVVTDSALHIPKGRDLTFRIAAWRQFAKIDEQKREESVTHVELDDRTFRQARWHYEGRLEHVGLWRSDRVLCETGVENNETLAIGIGPRDLVCVLLLH